LKKKVVGYSCTTDGNSVTLSNSRGDNISSTKVAELLSFLLEETDYGDGRPAGYHLKAVWDLDGFVAPIIRLMGQEVCKALAKDKRARISEHTTILYIPKKIFMIMYEPGEYYEARLYDMSQYYPEHEEQDELGVAVAGEVLLEALAKMEIPPPSKLTSPIAIYEDTIMKHLSLPTLKNMPVRGQSATEYAFRCAGKAWTSAFRLGHFNKTWDYDITAAYPFEASVLNDLRYCSYKRSDERIPSHIGFVRGTVTIKSDISPIIKRQEDGSLVAPKGTWFDYLTTEEWDFIDKWGIGTFEMKDGWFLTFKAPVKPLENPIRRLYEQRRKSQYDEVIDRLAKGISVGIVGKMGEQYSNGQPGDYFNPIWHAMTMSRVRLKVAEFIFRRGIGKYLLTTSVDGVLSSLDLKYEEEPGMGNWRLSGVQPALIVSSGQVFYGDKHPKGLDYETITGMIKRNPKNSYYGVWRKRPQTLAESAELDDFEDIGKVKKFWTAVDLTEGAMEHDRMFKKLPRYGGDLLKNRYSSTPLGV
jgi:hypothetical protein